MQCDAKVKSKGRLKTLQSCQQEAVAAVGKFNLCKTHAASFERGLRVTINERLSIRKAEDTAIE